MAIQETEHARLFEQRVQPSPATTIRDLPDGTAVVLNLDTERYFGLDAVASDMWSALSTSPSVGAAYRKLLEGYEVDPARLASDLASFVSELSSRGLVVLDDQEV